MELNAEKVRRGLECCANNDECVGEACPYYATGCENNMPKDALAIINSQEQRIKELTEENEAWQKQLITQKENADKAYYELACEIEDLRAENETLRVIIDKKEETMQMIAHEKQAYYDKLVIAKEMSEGEK